VRREVLEEVGVRVRDPRLFHLYLNRAEGKIDHVALFVATGFEGELRPDKRAIASVLLAPLDDPPEGTSPATRRRIAEYLGAPPADAW
jgi:8-oxo-dGTP pyrophosphatase MutT (NUDIX family)